MKFGTRFSMPHRVVGLEIMADGSFCARFGNQQSIRACAVVVATDEQYWKMPLAGCPAFEGRGVYYAATELKARCCRDTDAVVVGGGNSAGQAAMYLSRTARMVHVVVRGKNLAVSMSDYLFSRLAADPRIRLHFESDVTSLKGVDRLERLIITDRISNESSVIASRAFFVMVGASPNTAWLEGLVQLDDKGSVKTGALCGQLDSPYAASRPGIFAVGDVRAGPVKRVASAVGKGSVVISKVWDYVRGGTR